MSGSTNSRRRRLPDSYAATVVTVLLFAPSCFIQSLYFPQVPFRSIRRANRYYLSTAKLSPLHAFNSNEATSAVAGVASSFPSLPSNSKELKSGTYVVDGGELRSILGSEMIPDGNTENNMVAACIYGIVGRLMGDGTRVVGIGPPTISPSDSTVELSPGGVHFPSHAIAYIPDKISDDDALSTAFASVAVHRMAHGDSIQEKEVGGVPKGIVMGGDGYASFVSDALGCLGVKVTQVSTTKKKGGGSAVDLLPPAVGELEVDFSSYVGSFDFLVDTISDERNNDVGDAENPFEDVKRLQVFDSESVVIRELRRKFNCTR